MRAVKSKSAIARVTLVSLVSDNLASLRHYPGLCIHNYVCMSYVWNLDLAEVYNQTMKANNRRKFIVVAIAILILAVVYIELAVGLLGSPWAGS